MQASTVSSIAMIFRLPIRIFDDSGWPLVEVPGSWQGQGMQPSFDVGWYRMHFLLPDDLNLQYPAIQIGLIARADEVYLNGTRIGGEGRVGPGGSNWHNYAPALPRLYPFDRSLLHTESENVLAIRVARQPFVDEGGIVSGPVALGRLSRCLPGTCHHPATISWIQSVSLRSGISRARCRLDRVCFRLARQDRRELSGAFADVSGHRDRREPRALSFRREFDHCTVSSLGSLSG